MQETENLKSKFTFSNYATVCFISVGVLRNPQPFSSNITTNTTPLNTYPYHKLYKPKNVKEKR